MLPGIPREIFRFGPFVLDVDREELSRSGLILRIPRQPLRLLVLLVRRAGETIAREEIHQELWGSETYVDYEQGINTAIRQIRFSLGDNAEAPRYVRTIPRRGYVFIAPVERVAAPNEAAAEVPPPPPPLAAPPRRWRRPPRFSPGRRVVAAALAALIVMMMVVAAAGWRPYRRGETPPKRSCVIAVRPFEVLGRVPDGIDRRAFGEEIRATLASLPRRHVALVDANRARRADVVIEGTIQYVPEGIRVIVSGIDAASRTQLWSTTLDRPAARAPDLAIETAHRVLQDVAERYLPPPRHEPVVSTRVSARALALYRRGRLERIRMPERDWTRARDLFEQTVREEPRFAEAWSGLADLWAERMLRGPDRAVAAARTRECARRAIALQPENAEAHSALGIVALQYEYDLGVAEDAFRRAVAADPEYAQAHYNLAVALTTRGRFEEALRELRVARELDPVSFDLHPLIPMLYLHARRYDDAVAAFRDILAVRPEATNIRWGLLSTYIIQRQWAEAEDEVWQLAELSPAERTPVPATAEGFRALYRRLGPHLRARGRLMPHDFGQAIYYAELGDRERALAMLERAIASRTPSVSYLLVDPRFDPLRTDPRFNTLIAGTNLGRPRE